MKSLKIFVAFALVLALIPLAFADSCTSLTITTSTPSSTLTTGTSAVISSTLTASSSSCTSNVNIVSTGASSGGSFTVSDPATGSYSGSTISTGGTSKTFTVSSGTADTYDYYVTGGTSQSTTESLTYIASSTLTIDSASGPSSVTNTSQNQSFTLYIVLNNPQASDVTTSYALNSDAAQVSISGDSTSGSSTIPASSSTAFTYVVNITTASTSAFTITFDVGDTTDAYTVSVTPAAAATPTPTPTPAPTGTSSTGGSSGGAQPVSSATPAASTAPSTSSTPSVTASSTPQPSVPPVASISPANAEARAAVDASGYSRQLLDKANAAGIDVSDIEPRILTANELIQQGKYSEAQALLDEANSALESRLSAAGVPLPAKPLDWTPIVIVVAAILLVVGAWFATTAGKKR